MKLAFPEYWLWWLGLPVSLGLMYLVYKRCSHMIQSWFSEEQYERSYPLAKMGIRMAGFSLLFVSLLGPYWRTDEQEVPRVGRDIFFMLDVSASMNASDIKPSRLEKAKREIRRLIEQLDGDRVGIIAFTDVAYVQCPLTEDLAAAGTYLDMLATNQFAQTGTQFRYGLAAALDRFQSLEKSHPDRRARIIVILSDGEDHGDTYASLIQRLHQLNVTVFSVGIGSDEGAPIPEDPDRPSAGYLQDEEGRMAISRLASGALQEIAREFRTNYVAISDDRDHLDRLSSQLSSMSASPLERNLHAVAGNQYQVPLFPAVVLLLFSMFLMPIRKE